jgi:hypothetical protein
LVDVLPVLCGAAARPVSVRQSKQSVGAVSQRVVTAAVGVRTALFGRPSQVVLHATTAGVTAVPHEVEAALPTVTLLVTVHKVKPSQSVEPSAVSVPVEARYGRGVVDVVRLLPVVTPPTIDVTRPIDVVSLTVTTGIVAAVQVAAFSGVVVSPVVESISVSAGNPTRSLKPVYLSVLTSSPNVLRKAGIAFYQSRAVSGQELGVTVGAVTILIQAVPEE